MGLGDGTLGRQLGSRDTVHMNTIHAFIEGSKEWSHPVCHVKTNEKLAICPSEKTNQT